MLLIGNRKIHHIKRYDEFFCEGELFTDYDPNFPEEHLERKVAMVMVDDGKLLIVVE